MNAYAMEAGPAQFGGSAVDSVRRFFYRVAAAIAIVALLTLLFVLFVPMVIIGILYLIARSVLGSFGGVSRRPQYQVEPPAHQPIPEEDGEGRENVRVRRPDAE